MYDESGMMIGRYSATGQPLEELIYLEGRPVATVRDFTSQIELEVYPILTDHQGSPRKVVDMQGNPVWTWDSKDPYGNQRPNEYAGGGSTPFTFNMRFPGQWFDAETGLFHNGFRDYSPKLGRYIQADPIGLLGGMNSYAYVGSSPTNGVDPYGLYLTNESFKDPRVLQAMQFMSDNSLIARKIIRQAYASPLPLTIITGELDNEGKTVIDEMIPQGLGSDRNHLDSFVGAKITWNPTYGLADASCATPKGSSGSLPPALALIHEMVHFNQMADVDVFYGLQEMAVDQSRWGRRGGREKHAVALENQVAAEMGWLVRGAHIASPKYPLREYTAKSIFSAEADR